MTVTYDDARYLYDSARLTYDGALAIGLSGDEPASTGTFTRRATQHRAFAGNQPVQFLVLYDDPNVLYEQGGITYGAAPEVGILSWSGLFHRLLAGDQAAAAGDIAWIWSRFVWPEYAWTIDNTMEELAYTMTVSDDDQVQYEHQGGHDASQTEAEYTHIPVEPYHRQ